VYIRQNRNTSAFTPSTTSTVAIGRRLGKCSDDRIAPYAATPTQGSPKVGLGPDNREMVVADFNGDGKQVLAEKYKGNR
jgi:hypothetical protein